MLRYEQKNRIATFCLFKSLKYLMKCFKREVFKNNNLGLSRKFFTFDANQDWFQNDVRKRIFSCSRIKHYEKKS